MEVEIYKLEFSKSNFSQFDIVNLAHTHGLKFKKVIFEEEKYIMIINTLDNFEKLNEPKQLSEGLVLVDGILFSK